MQPTAEIARGLGPELTKQLFQLSDERDAARRRVEELKQLKQERLAEQAAHAQPVLAGASLAMVAERRGILSAADLVIGEIDQELQKAEQDAQRIGVPFHRLVETLGRKRKRLAELNMDILDLEAQRDKLAAELAA